jgi:hypothetical protein
MKLADPLLKRFSKARSERARLVVAGQISARHNRSKVAQGDPVGIAGRGLGSVTPLGCFQSRQQRLGHRNQLVGVRGWTAFRDGLFPLEVKSCAHGRDPTPQHLLGDGLLFRRQGFQNGAPVHVGWIQPPRTRPVGL